MEAQACRSDRAVWERAGRVLHRLSTAMFAKLNIDVLVPRYILRLHPQLVSLNARVLFRVLQQGSS